MKLSENLLSEVSNIFSTQWKERESNEVPDEARIQLGNDAVKLKAAVVYADLALSTDLVRDYQPWFAAEIYKAYLICGVKIIRGAGGIVTSFDGDRVMGVYTGDYKESRATKSALQINHAVKHIINPTINKIFPQTNYKVVQAVGVDVSSLFVAKVGIRNNNDFVWVGRSANYAAKLCGIRNNFGHYSSYITADIFTSISNDVKYSLDGRLMWSDRPIAFIDGVGIYGSDWSWEP